ncbi:MAG: Swt1 family HEPN domain-containing protein [Candidatus Poribacteria bacterium]|nr:Swt1 family HEPN domain-containing protein [Candidatus Poribacteria bacterium]
MSGMPNHIMMTRALNIYRKEMRSFIVKKLKREVKGDNTLDSLICDALNKAEKKDDSEFMRRFEENGGDASAAMDIGDFHHIARTHWNNVFKRDLQNDWSLTTDISEINQNARVEWAHPGEGDLDTEETIDNMKRLERALQAIGSPRAQMEVGYLRKELEGAAELAESELKFAAAWDGDHSGAEDGSCERVLFDGLSIYRKQMREFIRMRPSLGSLRGGVPFETVLRDETPAAIQASLEWVLNQNVNGSNVGIDIWFFPVIIDQNWQRSFADRFEGDREFLFLAYRLRSAVYSTPKTRCFLDAEIVRGHLTQAARALELIGHNAREARATIEEMRDTAYPLLNPVSSDPTSTAPVDEPDEHYDDRWTDVPEEWVPDDENGSVFWKALRIYCSNAKESIAGADEFEQLMQRLLQEEGFVPANPLAAEIRAFPMIQQSGPGSQNPDLEHQLYMIRSIFGNFVDQDGVMSAEDARFNLNLIARALDMMDASDARDEVIALREEQYPLHQEEQAEVNPFSGMELPALADEASRCQRCVLHNGRTNVVFGEGNEDADILFLGYIPHSGADQAGTPFVEDSENKIGRNVTRIIEENGLRREAVYLTYALKCKGKSKAGDREVETCRPYFLRQLELIQPQIVVALGEYASRALIETPDAFNEFIGELHDYEHLDGIKVLPTHFPTSQDKTKKAIKHLKQAIDTLDM